MNEPKPYLTVNGFFLIFAALLILLGMFLIFAPWGIPIGLFLLAIAAVFIAGVIVDSQARRRSRKQAAKQGLLIEHILYDPTFFDPQREFYFDDRSSIGYRKQWVYRYSMQHRCRKTAIWALVMPEVGAQVEYPNGWKLVVKQGQISKEFRQTVDDIANDPLWKRNPVWLEINSYPDKIGAVWDESNWKIAERLLNVLSEMSEKTE